MRFITPFFALLLVLVGLLPLGAQTVTEQTVQPFKPRVAVLPFAGGTGSDGEVLGRLFANEVANMGAFIILPRTAAIDAAMKEINFQKVGLTDPASIAKVGKGMNADYVIAGFISKLGNSSLLEVSMIEVETLVQMAGASKRYVDIGEGIDAMPYLVATVLGGTGRSMSEIQKPENNDNKVYKIGDFGPAGGIVFYDKGIYTNSWRYLEAAPSETEFITEWGAYERDITGTNTSVGSGKRNTGLIVEYLNTKTRETNKAAQLAVLMEFEGYTDWFLPSRGELDLMYKNLKKNGLGDFGDGAYWSSSQSSALRAWGQSFSNGHQSSYANGDDYSLGSYNYRTASLSVRVVRAF